MPIAKLFILTLIMIIGTFNSADAKMRDMEGAVMRGLDKVSARTQTFELPLGQTVRFGQNLYVRIRACRKSDPIDTPESAAFVEIWQKNIETDESDWIFSGWMFASSPALSAMDHDVYDVWVVDCKNVSKTAVSNLNEDTVEKSEADSPAEETSASEAMTPEEAAAKADALESGAAETTTDTGEN